MNSIIYEWSTKIADAIRNMCVIVYTRPDVIRTNWVGYQAKLRNKHLIDVAITKETNGSRSLLFADNNVNFYSKSIACNAPVKFSKKDGDEAVQALARKVYGKENFTHRAEKMYSPETWADLVLTRLNRKWVKYGKQ